MVMYILVIAVYLIHVMVILYGDVQQMQYVVAVYRATHGNINQLDAEMDILCHMMAVVVINVRIIL